jgi:hypothetical protein
MVNIDAICSLAAAVRSIPDVGTALGQLHTKERLLLYVILCKYSNNTLLIIGAPSRALL